MRSIAPNRLAGCLAGCLLGVIGVRGEEVRTLPDTQVVAERRAIDDPSLARWDEDAMAEFSPRTIDEMLATEPSFSLYRRQSAVFGNPTTSGVSLRRTGATAASRTLVLRDGIPQNDPFGGWVSWARYHPELLSSARLVPSAQSAAWGNQSPAGVVQLTSRVPRESGARIGVTAGSDGTWGGSVGAELVSRDGTVAAHVAGFSLQSDGFYGLRKGQRGPVDRPLDLDTRGAEGRLVWRPSRSLTVEPAFSYYEEERGNGTRLARNESEALDLSLRVTGERPAGTWQALVYYQRRDFEALFSSVTAGRRSERPALDQFDVPGEGVGGGWSATLVQGDRHDLLLGADLRYLQGETNENAGFVDGSFLRRRRAGGDQFVGGAFVRSSHRFDQGTAVDASLRLDFWALRDGERVERRPSTGALLRRENFPDREGFEPSLSLSVRQPLCETVTFSASAGTSFRLPTINELYRPFRVRNDITEANTSLDPERFVSVDAGLRWEPDDSFAVALDLFHHWIRDAVANVPITDPEEAAGVAGFVPPGGTVAQRRNVDAARVWGLETRMHWRPTEAWLFSLNYLYSQASFVDSPGQPLLEGNRFPQAPEHRAVAGIECTPSDALLLFAQVDVGSEQFDDALESRRLPSWWNTRLGARLNLRADLSVHARVENLFDEEIVTGRSSSGLESVGTPRSFWMSVRYAF